MIKRLTIIRHGETAHNNDGIIQGWINTSLNEQGQEQVRKASHGITMKPEIIFSSDLGRALESARAIQDELGYEATPTLIDWRLRERHFGTAEGQSRTQIDMNAFYNSDPGSKPYNAESENQFSERVWSFIQDLSLIEQSDILITTHSGVLNRFGYLLDPDFTFIKYDNAAIVYYEFDTDAVVNQLMKDAA